jgi:hypothetical protein
MAVSLKNVSGEPVYLGRPDGRRIDDGEVIHVDGTIDKDSPEDAYVIGAGDQARAYPKSMWKATGGKKADSDEGTTP